MNEEKDSIVSPIQWALYGGKSEGQTRKIFSSLPWAAFAATLFVSLRIWSVAHLNLPVALQLVELTDTNKVLLGLAVVLLPTLILGAALYVHLVCTESLTDLVKSARAKEPPRLSNRALAFAFLWLPVVFVALAFIPTSSALLILPGMALLTVSRVTSRSRPEKGASSNDSPDSKAGIPYRFRIIFVFIGLIGIGIGFFLIALDDTPWLPAEQIGLTNRATMVGYVAAQSDSQLTILIDSGRNITTVSMTDVRYRRLCQISKPAGGNTLIARLFWGHDSTTPLCPSPSGQRRIRQD
jgi:hypothetical protein